MAREHRGGREKSIGSVTYCWQSSLIANPKTAPWGEQNSLYQEQLQRFFGRLALFVQMAFADALERRDASGCIPMHQVNGRQLASTRSGFRPNSPLPNSDSGCS